jgi:hypothetical protein
MSTRIRDVLMGRLGELRQADPGDARRADPVDSTRALLVWEPKRIVPSYAVPLDDVDGDLPPVPAEAEAVAGPPRHPFHRTSSRRWRCASTSRPRSRPRRTSSGPTGSRCARRRR